MAPHRGPRSARNSVPPGRPVGYAGRHLDLEGAIMSGRTRLIVAAPALVAAAVLVPASAFLGRPSWGEPPGPPASRVMTAKEASTKASAWGEMHTYFRGETFGTTNAYTAIAVVKPGEAVHPAH